jgi:ABC-2 type transport system permease protein
VSRDPTAAALFGVTGPLTSPGGWLNANIYGNFLPLIMLLVTVGYGAAALAGQDEDGTLCLLATLPVSRARLVAEKAGAMALEAAGLAGAVAACVLAGRSFDLTVPVGNVISISVATALMGLDLGLMTMAVGALSGKRGAALGAGTALAAGSYLVSSLAPVVAWLRPARYASLLYWSVGHGQVDGGVAPGDYAVLLSAGIAAWFGAKVAFDRLDLH